MPEQKSYRGRPIRRTKASNGLVKIIFDDGSPGMPGDVIYVKEDDYVNGVTKEIYSNRGDKPLRKAVSTEKAGLS